MRLYVARHGETDWNRAGRYQGRRESDLTPRGELQAAALAARLAEEEAAPSRIYSSPLRRCRQTARPFSERAGIDVEADERLIEIAHGPWEGRLRGEIERDDAERMRMWREDPAGVTFPGGETVAQVRDRWRDFVAGLSAANAVAIYTHDVVVRVAILEAKGLPLDAFWQPRVANGAYATFDLAGGAWHVAAECVDGHLAEIAADAAAQAL